MTIKQIYEHAQRMGKEDCILCISKNDGALVEVDVWDIEVAVPRQWASDKEILIIDM